jgi:pimeloyl-ACP methyl ester carboxylesterase
MHDEAYQPLKRSQELRRDIRGVNYLVRTWGPDSAPPLVLLHGTRDTSHTFQFLVDALKGDWRIIAPDWRGHGHTTGAGHNWFHDYLADLDALLDVLHPGQVDLVGHSLGGNVASVYAGLRPERVRHLVSLDAFGILPPSEGDFPKLIASWLRSDRSSGLHMRYSSIEQMAQKLCSANPRLSRDKALYLALNLSRPLTDGALTWQFASDRWRSMPTLHTQGEWIACWRGITAPKLWIAAADPLPGSLRSDPKAFAFMCDHIGPESLIFLPDTGHNLHHDAPLPLAQVIEKFLCGEDPSQ